MRINHRTLSLTPELVALVERIEPDPGPEPGSTEHSAADFAALAAALLAEYRPARLCVFAYGSLIWSPEFEHETMEPAVASGWHRAFCLHLTRWRGTREVPALMMALDRGGSCEGILYELPAGGLEAQVVRLLEREIDGNPPTNVPRWIWVQTAAGRRRALTFVAAKDGPAYAGRLPLETVAGITARAAGHWGSAAIYLQRTVEKLEEHGIRDRNLWKLQALVAAEIRAGAGGG